MALKFLTLSQHMIFVDTDTHAAVSAWELLPNKTYDVFFTIRNDGLLAAWPADYSVRVWHSQFGIGSGSGTDGVLLQPVSEIVPPGSTATLYFQFNTSDTGHCCFTAQIHQPATATTGPVIGQNLDVQDSAIPVGSSSPLPFSVYWDLTRKITLTVTEKSIHDDDRMTALTAADPTWSPRFHIPTIAGLITTPAPPDKVKLDNTSGVAPNPTYCHLDVNPRVLPAGIKGHLFHILGTDETGRYIGEADIRVTHPVAGVPVRPAPYLDGGYQSADIIIRDAAGHTIPRGGEPGTTRWDTLLDHDTDYDLSARIHNDSRTPAYNTVVRFWAFDGGVGSVGTLLGTQTITVPAYGSYEIKCPAKFRTAARGRHRCAAVSIYSVLSGRCMVNATTSAMVPDPGHDGEHSCSGWRNTDSRFVNRSEIWKLHFDILPERPLDPIGPVAIRITTLHVPAGWNHKKEVTDIDSLLRSVGLGREVPLHMVPALRPTLAKADLKTTVKVPKGTKMEGGNGEFTINTAGEKSTPFEVHGEIPKDAKDGDKFLVNVTAHYPKTKHSPERFVEFLEVLYVTDEVRKEKTNTVG